MVQATLARVLASVALPEALPANARSANFQRRQAQRSARPSERDDCKRRPWARREELIDDHDAHLRYALEGELEEEGLIQCNDLVFRAAGLLPTIGKKDRYSRGESQAGHERELHAHAKHIRVPSSTNVQRRSSRGTKPKSSSLLTNHMMVLALV